MSKYTGYLGGFDYEHKNPPKPFNPEADARAEGWYNATTTSMMRDKYYSNHTRAECKKEWAKRYDSIKNEAKNSS